MSAIDSIDPKYLPAADANPARAGMPHGQGGPHSVHTGRQGPPQNGVETGALPGISDLLGVEFFDLATQRVVAVFRSFQGHEDWGLYAKIGFRRVAPWERLRKLTPDDTNELRAAIADRRNLVRLVDWNGDPSTPPVAPDTDVTLDCLVDRACNALLRVVNFLDEHRGADGVTLAAAQDAKRRLDERFAGFRLHNLANAPVVMEARR